MTFFGYGLDLMTWLGSEASENVLKMLTQVLKMLVLLWNTFGVSVVEKNFLGRWLFAMFFLVTRFIQCKALRVTGEKALAL